MKETIKHKLVETPFGNFSMKDVDEIGIGYDYDFNYDDRDIYAKVGKFDFFFIDAVPPDYNIYERDCWSYGGLRSEGHYTITECNYDMTTGEWVREEIEPIDIIDMLRTHKEINCFTEDGKRIKKGE